MSLEILDKRQVQSCATCDFYSVECGEGGILKIEDVHCPFQSKMTGFRPAFQVCEKWQSEYLDDTDSRSVYFKVLKDSGMYEVR